MVNLAQAGPELPAGMVRAREMPGPPDVPTEIRALATRGEQILAFDRLVAQRPNQPDRDPQGYRTPETR